MEFHKVSRFYETLPLSFYTERVVAQSQESFALRFDTILEKFMIQPYLMGVIRNSSSRFHHVFKCVGLLAVLIY